MIAKFECQIAKYMLASFLKAVAVLTVFSHSRLYLGMPNVILLTSVELEAEVSTSSGRSLKGGGMRLLLAALRPAPPCLNFHIWYFKCLFMVLH